MSKTKIILALSILLLSTLACNTLASPTPSPLPTAELIPTIIVELVDTPTPGSIPLTEANLPRVSLEEARVAIESGAAIVVDVRSKESYAVSHVPGALNIPLDEIELNPTGVNLAKDQWIITYCT